MALLPQLTRRIGQPLFLPAHGRGAALPDGLRQLLRRRAGIWDLPELPALGGPLEADGASGGEPFTTKYGGGWEGRPFVVSS